MQRPSTPILFLLSLLCGTPPAAAQQNVRDVVITSSWVGLGKPEKTVLLIRRDGKSFRRGRQRIEASHLAFLTAALDEKTLDSPVLSNLGITPGWLKSVVNDDGVSIYWIAGAPNQKDLFVSSFTDVASVAKAIPTLFNFVMTDNYPSIEVTLNFDDGSSVSASSRSQYVFMLPWTVVRNGATVTTFNANISRAVAALMPSRVTNRSRIGGEDLQNELAEAVSSQIKEEWNLLGVENKASDTLSLLKAHYIVERADINGYHNVDYGKEWVKGGPKELNLQVTLRRVNFPQNFSEHAILLYEGGKVHGTEAFLGTIGIYEGLVSTVPWLAHFSQDYPSVQIQLVFVHDRSFGEKAMAVFAADMAALGKGDLVQQVRAVQDRVALLAAGFGRYWLVLPDRRMILWRYSERAGLLQWAPADFVTKRCSDYNTPTGGCVGAVVLPDGTLVR